MDSVEMFDLELKTIHHRLQTRLKFLERGCDYLRARIDALLPYANAHRNNGVQLTNLWIYYEEWIRTTDYEIERIRMGGLASTKEADSRSPLEFMETK
jgi:hypothetical protein